MHRKTKQYALAAAATGLAGLAAWMGMALLSAEFRAAPGHSPLPGLRQLPPVKSGAASTVDVPALHHHLASSGSRVANATDSVSISTPATLSQTQINAVKLPKGFVLAQVPWSQDITHPVKVFVPVASLPWLRDRANPVNVFVPLASLPWADCQVVTVHIPHAPQRWGIPDCQFVMALCRDRQGNIWIATEGSGVFRYAPAAPKGKQWLHFTKQNTQSQLGNNNIYAIACDNHGRVWAGTLNHGVSVFNGRRWQDYDIVQNPKDHVLAGPLGNHVFAMKFDPYTAQMWICTEAGISIYQCNQRATSNEQRNAALNEQRSTPAATYNLSPVTYKPGTWHYIPNIQMLPVKSGQVTQANGLPQNPDCIAFNPNGTVYVGSQCGGIAIGTPSQKPGVRSEELEVSGNASLPNSTTSRLPPSNQGTVSTHYSLSAASHHSFGTPPYRWRVITGPWKMPLTATGPGLPSNLINCLAIAPNGTVITGTDGGIAFAASNETLRSTSNEQRTTANTAHIATGSAGGLIARQIRSDVTSPMSAKMYWTFEHGQDFPAKVLGLWHPPQHWKAPSGEVLETLPMEDYTTALALNVQRPTSNEQQAGTPVLLSAAKRSISLRPQGRPSHYSLIPARRESSRSAAPTGIGISASTPQHDSLLWIGHRQCGLDVWQYNSAGKITKRWQIREPQIGNYVTCLLPLPSGAMAVGTYGKGVSIITLPGASDAWEKNLAPRKKPSTHYSLIPARRESPRTAAPTGIGISASTSQHYSLSAAFPHPAAPPTRQQLATLAQRLAAQLGSASHKQPAVVALNDDWRTQGSWLGRYGKFWIDLCGMWQRHGAHRYGLLWGYGTPWMQFRIRMAKPFHDVVRAWMANTASYSHNSLEEPLPFFDLKTVEGSPPNRPDRRQSENDDHGEKYSTARQGPGLEVSLTAPRGWTLLSLYEYNNDGHFGDGDPRRDFRVAVSEAPYSVPGLSASATGMSGTAQVSTRVVNFAGGGVWKRFLVRGPADVVIRIKRNHSFNTILNAVALDWALERPPPYFISVNRWWLQVKQRHGAEAAQVAEIENGVATPKPWRGNSALALCERLSGFLRLQRQVAPAGWAADGENIYCLIERRLEIMPHAGARAQIATESNYRLCRFKQYESDLKRLGLPIPREMEQKLKWTGHFRVFRNGGYLQLARTAAGGPTGNWK